MIALLEPVIGRTHLERCAIGQPGLWDENVIHVIWRSLVFAHAECRRGFLTKDLVKVAVIEANHVQLVQLRNDAGEV